MPRALLTAAVEAMAPSRREATLAAIDANLLAASTRRAMESRVRTVATLAEAGEFALFPLDANKLHIIAGALRIGNYRSAGLYLDAVIWHQENQMHMPVSAALRRAAKTLTKAALRGLPGSRLKQAFDLDELAQLVVYDAADEPFDVTRVEHAVDVVMVATWFMLREIEMAGAKVKDMIVTTTTVSLDIPLPQNGAGGADRAHPTHLQMRLRVGGTPTVPQVRGSAASPTHPGDDGRSASSASTPCRGDRSFGGAAFPPRRSTSTSPSRST